MVVKRFLILPALLGVSAMAAAQQPVDTAGIYKDRKDTLSASVFTAERPSSFLSRSTGVRTEVITADGICRMACCNLAESFENSASVGVDYSDAVTGARQIRLLGLSGIYTQMLDENRPVMRGLNAPFGLSYVPGAWLQSIQIAKGAPSVINGVESMTGQINVEHRKPTDEVPLFVNGAVMSDSKADLNIASSHELNEKLTTILLGHADANFRSHDMNKDGFMDEPRLMQFDLSNRWLYYLPELQVRWGVSAIYDRRKGGQEGYRKDSYAAGDPWGTDILNRSLGAYFKLGRAFREDQSESVALVADYMFTDMDAHFGPAAFDASQHAAFANLLYQNAFNETHSLTAGLSATCDLFREGLDRLLPGFDNSVAARHTDLVHGGAYAEYTLHGGTSFTAITGVRGEWYNGNGFRVAPRMTLRWQPVEWTVLRANGGRGLRNAMPLMDHFGVFSTGKQFVGDYMDHYLEDSWIFGGNATFYFPWKGAYLSLDYFGTRFARQMVADYEEGPGRIAFYPVRGGSMTDSFQADLHMEPLERFTVDLTGRYTLASVRYRGRGWREMPMTTPFKAVLNLQYKTRLSKWIFDFTASVSGSARVYDFMKSEVDDDGSLLYADGRTPVYPQLYAQVTRRFRGFDIYVGGENLTAFRQKHVILGDRIGDRIDATTSAFDASAVWGPMMGAKLYAGFRITLWRSE